MEKKSSTPESVVQAGKSFLDRSISQIKESKSNSSRIFDSRSNETELKILQ